MTFKRHLAAGLALTVSLFALTGSALAAPPSTPPGQEKKAEKQAEQQAEQALAATETAAASQAATVQSSGGINATTAGVKPSNNTDKNTWCETGGSGATTTCTRRTPPATNLPADSSKRYGNGTTAAQIATSRGAPAGTDVYGPGNSQPHKVCGKNGHFIDVHAVKSYVGISCNVTTTTTTTTPQSQTATAATTTNSTTATSSTTQTGSTASTGGGVAAGKPGSPHSGPNAAGGGVLGAFGVAGQVAGTLPFTGFPLWLAILVGIALISIGWALYRRGSTATPEPV